MFRLVFHRGRSERLMVQHKGDGEGEKEMVREPIFHTCTFFFDNSFFPLVAILWICNIKPNSFPSRKSVHFYAYTHEAETDVDTNPRTQVSVSISLLRERNPQFSRKKSFLFIFYSARLQRWWFSCKFFLLFRGCFSISISICVYRFQRGKREKARKKRSLNHLPSCVLLVNRKRERKNL